MLLQPCHLCARPTSEQLDAASYDPTAGLPDSFGVRFLPTRSGSRVYAVIICAACVRQANAVASKALRRVTEKGTDK